ncbi:MAG: FtsX-like permease family protein [Luteitalea sp.]|nr:FtsX-like permease family protein [Luteitalea sp.]
MTVAHLLLDSNRDPSDRGSGRILRASTLEAHLSDSRALDRLTTTLVGLCGLIALAMATIGVYGIMTDAVQRRTREIGLRVALGAGRAHVARLVFTEAIYLAVAGLLVGAAAAVTITHVARSVIGATASLDIAMLAAASGALAAVIAVAAILPLRRALRVSPNIALRAE